MRIQHLLIVTALLATACDRGPAAGGPAAGGRRGGPAAIKSVPHENHPIEDTTDFISTVRSLNSTTVQPQVEGRVTKIFVKSGDVVKPGTPMLQIDPEKQAATVRNTESQRAAREADVT